MIERVEWPRTHCNERLAEQYEIHDLYRSGRTARRFARQRRNPRDARVGKDGRVKPGGFLGLLRVPEERGDLLHADLLLSFRRGPSGGRGTPARLTSGADDRSNARIDRT